MGDTYIMAVFRIYTWREAHTYTRTVQRTESINTEEFSVGKYGFVLSAKRTTPCSPCAIRNVYVQNATQSQWIWSIRMKPNWQHHTQSQSHSHSFVRSFVRSIAQQGNKLCENALKLTPCLKPIQLIQWIALKRRLLLSLSIRRLCGWTFHRCVF